MGRLALAAAVVLAAALPLTGCGQTPDQKWAACMQRQLRNPSVVCVEPPQGGGQPSPRTTAHRKPESPYQWIQQCMMRQLAKSMVQNSSAPLKVCSAKNALKATRSGG